MDSWLLAIATSGPRGEVGLRAADGTVRTRPLGEGAARGRGLLPTIEALLAEAEVRPSDLAGVAVDVGPGSFTGTRVGVTAAKTLAWALGIPAVGVLSLRAIARAAPPTAAVLALRDAGRGQVYFARFGPVEAGARAEEVPPRRGGALDVLAAQGAAAAAGEDAVRLAGEIGLRGVPLPVAADAAAVLAEALPRFAARDFVPAHQVSPVYLQPSTPELRRQERDGSPPS